ncbi:hypothetical protein, partial [Streptomyces sp. NPDC047028]|uniref:hypothetical protein n=1 Tax=Streptomyces sp. NPDC047028 TaxID=3155793 RepID=UPI0033FABC1C
MTEDVHRTVSGFVSGFRSSPGPKRHRARIAGALAVLCVGSGLLAAPPAQAANDTPTPAELLAQCNNGTDKCVFHPSGAAETVAGDSHQVGDSTFNCTRLTQRSGVGWSDTVEESNSLGLATTTGVGTGTELPGWKVSLTFSVTVSYEHTWKHASTTSATTFVDVRPNSVGWVTRVPDLQRVKGTYELIFGKRFHGHYYWYV